MKKFEYSLPNRGLAGSPRGRATMSRSLPYEIHPHEIHPRKGKHSSAVLALHGYTGSPSDLKYLAERLALAGFGVQVPRLPGAGTDMDDLSNTTRQDWMRRVYDAWLDLRARYDKVSVVGYSMGGLLALELASQVEITKTILLAPALFTSHKFMYLLPILRPLAGILPRLTTRWDPGKEDSEETIEHGKRYWVRRDLKSASQFSLLQAEIRRHLKTVKTPVMAIVSSRDSVVPPAVLNLLNQRLPERLSGTLVVNNCGHNVPQGPDRRVVADTVVDWLKEKNETGILKKHRFARGHNNA